MGRQITLLEMIKECEDEQNNHSKTEDVSGGRKEEGDKEEILPQEHGGNEMV